MSELGGVDGRQPAGALHAVVDDERCDLDDLALTAGSRPRASAGVVDLRSGGSRIRGSGGLDGKQGVGDGVGHGCTFGQPAERRLTRR